MTKARTYVRPDAARDAARSAGIPEAEIALVQNEHTGRWSYLRLPSGAQHGSAPPHAPRVPKKTPETRRPTRAVPARTQPVESRYAPLRKLVVLNEDIMERIDAARYAVKPGTRVPNRSEIIRTILDSKLPQAGSTR